MVHDPNSTETKPLRFVIVGGVAAGASAAARARRLSESAEIILLERGPDVSFANCGLPYYIGDEITNRADLAIQTPQTLKAMLNIDVRTNTEATGLDCGNKTLEIRDLKTGTTESIAYDKLLLATGASPIRPNLPGINDGGIHTLRSLEDMDRIKEAVESVNHVTVIGAGFIGLEIAEQMIRKGKQVTLVEMVDQVLPPLDRPMTLLLEDELHRNQVDLVLGDGIAGFQTSNTGSLVCRLRSGREIETDLVVLGIGVRPETGLARGAGIELGPKGHIRVDRFMQTNVPCVYAAGDAVETEDLITAAPTAVPLGGPANRQGRVAADHIFRGEKARPYPGSLGTAVVRVFEVAAGLTGWTEKRLASAGMDYRAVTVGDNHHAGYYPGAKPLTLKLLWDPENGRVLGAQVTGFEGVDKRLDVMATAIAGGLTVDDLCHLELAYAPPFGSAKDIVNLAGFAATNAEDGLAVFTDVLPEDTEVQLVDLRPPALVRAHPFQTGRSGISRCPCSGIESENSTKTVPWSRYAPSARWPISEPGFSPNTDSRWRSTQGVFAPGSTRAPRPNICPLNPPLRRLPGLLPLDHLAPTVACSGPGLDAPGRPGENGHRPDDRCRRPHHRRARTNVCSPHRTFP
jgi:NADPH-dependent 2,4-dienoyl-CoA reductase/sulfur reductase-like enzyme